MIIGDQEQAREPYLSEACPSPPTYDRTEGRAEKGGFHDSEAGMISAMRGEEKHACGKNRHL